MIRSLFAATILFAAPAAADPDRISILLGSNHIAAKMDFEEVNPGVFLTWERTRIDWSVGVYRNSFGKPSVAVTAALPILRWRDGEVAIFAGAALYPGEGRTFAAHVGDVVPLAGIQLRQGNVFAQIIPSDGRTAAAIVSVGVTFALNE
jgi:hypothetical protein